MVVEKCLNLNLASYAYGAGVGCQQTFGMYVHRFTDPNKRGMHTDAQLALFSLSAGFPKLRIPIGGSQ